VLVVVVLVVVQALMALMAQLTLVQVEAGLILLQLVLVALEW
jgi:hypothetical protein